MSNKSISLYTNFPQLVYFLFISLKINDSISIGQSSTIGKYLGAPNIFSSSVGLVGVYVLTRRRAVPRHMTHNNEYIK